MSIFFYQGAQALIFRVPEHGQHAHKATNAIPDGISTVLYVFMLFFASFFLVSLL